MVGERSRDSSRSPGATDAAGVPLVKETAMTQLTEQTPPPSQPPAEADLAAAVHRVLAASDEPLTLPKLRAKLPAPFRNASPEELTECLRRQVAADVVHPYPKYRSQQDRYWDRTMPVHIAALVRGALQEGPLAWSELRRKLPPYALAQAEGVLTEQVAQGLLFRHPAAGKRGGPRYGAQPPNPRDYLKEELAGVFQRLERLGFSQTQLRAGALEVLHDEEWAPTPPATPVAIAPQPVEAAAEPTPPAAETTDTHPAVY
jgi:hypothetical protein